MASARWIQIDVEEVLVETEQAFCFLLDEEEYWIPKSQIDDAHEIEQGQVNIVVRITTWIAEQKGIA